ncbi:MAG: M3 family metallopeptidase [Cyanobacteriota bacterium]|nr:M3 family metallopeptidase [Cyanobacteriota bacterium]
MALPQTAEHLDQDWDLSDLYANFRDPQFAQDLAAVQERARDFRTRYHRQVSSLSPGGVGAALQEMEAIHEQSLKIYSYPMLRFSADTRDSQAKQFYDQVQEVLTDVGNQLLFFNLELQQMPPTDFARLANDASLASYKHFLSRLAALRSHQLEESVEQTLNQAALTGREAFIKLREVHLGGQSYPAVTTPEGKTVSTESELGSLLYHPQPEVRLAGYRAIRQVLANHNPLYGYILNTIIQDHRLESGRRGYDSTLAKQLLVDEVSLPIFEALMEGTRDRFDLFQRYYRLKGRSMGRSVRICDLYAPWSSAAPPITYEDGVAILMQALREFSSDYAEQAKPFFEKQWVDARVRPGKRGGAFCAYVNGLHSYLLLSYTDTYHDLFTLAHELGHGLHFERIRARRSYLNSDPPMVLAEIASTFNELLLLDYLLKQSKDSELLQALLTQQLEDQLNLLFRQSTISRLELTLHQRATHGSFDHDFINEEWLKIYQDLCGDAVELLPEHQYDWARIGHIFFKPFYCYNYTLSFVVAIACYQQYKITGKDFVPKYLKLLDMGGSRSPEQALQTVGIDLADPATISQALDYTESLIDKLEDTLA